MNDQLQTKTPLLKDWLSMGNHFNSQWYFFLLLLATHSLFGLEQSKNDTKIIDLQETIIDDNTEINLNSDWSFYWSQLIEPGKFEGNDSFTKVSLHNWTEFNLSKDGKMPSFGFATYRLKISIAKDRPPVSLFIPATYSSSKTWINGKLTSEIGKVGNSKELTLHRRFSQIIPLNTNETDFEIVIQVANFYHKKGGIDQPIILGSSSYLHSIKSKRIVADIVFIGCLGFIGVFFLLFFLFYWNKDRAVLYFSILCILLSYRALSDKYAPLTDFSDSISWIFLTKIEYISLFLAGAFASLFFSTIFSRFIHKFYLKIIIYSSGFLAILTVFLPAPHFTKLISPFLTIMIINLIYITFVIMKAMVYKRHESILLLASMLLGANLFYVNIFLFLGENGNEIIYLNFGYVLVFLLFSMLLMTRFSNSFEELDLTKGFALEQKNEISKKSNEVSKLNLELKENLKQLQNSNTELDSFNHIVSHDLKAPLVSMYTLISFIEEDLETILDKSSKRYFNLLKDKISKMNALINDLLMYSKIAKGNKLKERFIINDLLKEVIDTINHQNESTINLPDKNFEIYANKIELKHVFQNLISNSIKHNDKDKVVINISIFKLPEKFIFSVSDNGPGIASKYHGKIFEMFSQLNDNKEANSTGIGLAIVKKIVSENNGVISVESKKNIGTTIKFSWKILKK